MAEDYYKSLGIPKTATADEIRKAYRKLARANHPDAKPDDPQAATKFKEIQDAYDVLSDAKKRQQYDQFGVDFSKMGPGSGPTGRGPGPGGSGTMDFSDFFGPGGVDLGEMLRGGGAAADQTKSGSRRRLARHRAGFFRDCHYRWFRRCSGGSRVKT